MQKLINNCLPVMGLEIHVELSSKSKMFCSCSADHFAKKPNTQVCPVCLGYPGAMPYPNWESIESTIKFGLSLDCSINKYSKFDRKHYFYPDLPKGYQISQYDQPFCINGIFEDIKNNEEIRIRRVHLEEDTAKLIHESTDDKGSSFVDFNRSGVSLMEIVTEPDFNNVESVISFLKEIQLIVRYLDISDADMEKGSMRLEANISLLSSEDLKASRVLPNYKVELKNINSFRFLEKAIIYEISRQSEIINSGKKVIQETRGFDQNKNITYTQRVKEEANDYRYFPEPDIPVFVLDGTAIDALKESLPELPKEKRIRFKKDYELSYDYIEVLISDKKRAEYFEEAVKLSNKFNISSKFIADCMVNKKLDEKYPEPAGLIKEIYLIQNKDYSSKDETLSAIEKVISVNEKAVNDYKKGKQEVLMFLIGQVQKELKGSGNGVVIKELLINKICR